MKPEPSTCTLFLKKFLIFALEKAVSMQRVFEDEKVDHPRQRKHDTKDILARR